MIFFKKKNENSTKAAVISMSDISFAPVQFQMISVLHCYYFEAHFAMKSLFPTFYFFFRLKLLKSVSVKLQLTFRFAMMSFST